MIDQLSLANARIQALVDEEVTPQAPRSDDVLQLAGVLDGWSVDTGALSERIRFVEDDDMRRTREARQRKR